jgi:two-component system sensor histidine kinase KdpD
MNAKLYTVFIADPEKFLTKTESLHIHTFERLCQEFGGEFIHLKSSHVPQAIAQFAATHHITQIVIGESQQPRWKKFFKRSFTQRLLELIRDQKIDLHIIATEK